MTGKIALVTGASRGLGRAGALHLAAQGIDIIGTYKSSEKEAGEVVRDVASRGAKAAMLQMDAEADDFADFAQRVATTLKKTFGRDKLDHLVNNAGIGFYAPLAETTGGQLDLLYRVHVRTPMLLMQALLPHMNEGGHVLFVSSGLTRFTLPGYAGYAAMKGAVEVLTHYASKELGERGIRANCLAPGAIETDFGGGVVRDNPEVNQHIASTTALGRVGKAEDIGAAIAALLSGGLDWMSGTRIEVSGGQSL